MISISKRLYKILGLSLTLSLCFSSVMTVNAQEAINQETAIEETTTEETVVEKITIEETAVEKITIEETTEGKATSEESVTGETADESLMREDGSLSETVESLAGRIDNVPISEAGISQLTKEQEDLSNYQQNLSNQLNQEIQVGKQLSENAEAAQKEQEKADQIAQQAEKEATDARENAPTVNTKAIQWLSDQLNNENGAVYQYFFTINGGKGTPATGSLDSAGLNYAPGVIKEMRDAGVVGEDIQFMFRIYRENNNEDGTPSFNIFWIDTNQEIQKGTTLEGVIRFNTTTKEYAVGNTVVKSAVADKKDILQIDGGEFAKKKPEMITEKVDKILTAEENASKAKSELAAAQKNLETATEKATQNEQTRKELTDKLTDLQSKLEIVTTKLSLIENQLTIEKEKLEELKKQQEQAIESGQSSDTVDEQIEQTEAEVANLQNQIVTQQTLMTTMIEETVAEIEEPSAQVLGAGRVKEHNSGVKPQNNQKQLSDDTIQETKPFQEKVSEESNSKVVRSKEKLAQDTETITIEESETALAATPGRTFSPIYVWILLILLAIAVAYLFYCRYKNQERK